MKLTRRRVFNGGCVPEVMTDSDVALFTAGPFGFHEPSSFTPFGLDPPDGVGFDQLSPEGK